MVPWIHRDGVPAALDRGRADDKCRQCCRSAGERGQDIGRVQSLASSPEIKEAFKQQASRALERGIFGAPSFVVAKELFWGDDRLEDAIAFARSKTT
ncbi:MAG TPA: DsbA family protein [Ramlibacter sp.]|nr:DsbA family protein [Ramlibacter sp.]